MEIRELIPIDEINSSFHGKRIKCIGKITQISKVFSEGNNKYIQVITLCSIKELNPKSKIQQEIYIILDDRSSGKVSLGEKIEVIGELGVRNIRINQPKRKVIYADHLIKITDFELFHPSEQEIKAFKTFSEKKSVQQLISQEIFDKILIGDDIKLIGTLLLFCTKSPRLVKNNIPCYVSLLIVGPSGTFKTYFLNRLKSMNPIDIINYSQISETRFLTYKTRYMIGGDRCFKAGLSDLAENGMILIDNLEELKLNNLNNLRKNFKGILERSSLIAAVRNNGINYDNNRSVYKNVKFLRKETIIKKFDIILTTKADLENTIDELLEFHQCNEDKIDNNAKKTQEFLKKYINYARTICDPYVYEEGVEEAIEMFIKDVLTLNKDKAIYINQQKQRRIREIIIVLSMSYARMALRSIIRVNDIKEITRIIQKTLKYSNLV